MGVLLVEDLDVTLTVTHYREAPEPRRGPTIRSCWVCNPAHEHLKACKWLICFICDKNYRLGVPE